MMPEGTALPAPSERYPVELPDGSRHTGTVFLNAVIDHPQIEIGDYSYASDFEPPQDWAARLAPYLHPGARERLVMGRFCAVAHGVRFITAAANHATRGLTTYPLPIFDPARIAEYRPDTRDTMIGHDVWFGYGAMILPGAQIGSGAIIGAGAVVRGTVPPYAVVTGNPGQIQRMRFAPEVIDRLLALRWWDWPPELIARAEPALLGGEVAALEAMAP